MTKTPEQIRRERDIAIIKVANDIYGVPFFRKSDGKAFGEYIFPELDETIDNMTDKELAQVMTGMRNNYITARQQDFDPKSEQFLEQGRMARNAFKEYFRSKGFPSRKEKAYGHGID